MACLIQAVHYGAGFTGPPVDRRTAHSATGRKKLSRGSLFVLALRSNRYSIFGDPLSAANAEREFVPGAIAGQTISFHNDAHYRARFSAVHIG